MKIFHSLQPSSGLYAIPITKAKQLINNLNRESDMYITLTMTNNKDNHNIALNLHVQKRTPKSRAIATTH